MILLDPEILVPPRRDWTSEDYWLSLSEWSRDRRVRLGPSTVSFSHTLLAEIDWPGLAATSHVRPDVLARDLMRSLNRLLSRVAEPTAEYATPRELKPSPRGDPLGAEALSQDLAKVADVVEAIATVDRSWDTGTPETTSRPIPPDRFELLFEPGAEICTERLDLARRALRGRRIRVVGGRKHQRSVERLEALGSEVQWLLCERRKKPRMSERWSKLDRARDIAVIVTGKIGHSVSDDAAQQCTKAQVVPVFVDNPEEVADGVIDSLDLRC